MPISPVPITGLPAAPDRADRSTFSTRAVNMFTALKDVFVGQVNAIAVTANTNATEAAASAISAATDSFNASVAAANAATAAGAPMWITGTTYALGNATWSPINRMVYRKITTSSVSNTDPSADPANWSLLGTIGLSVVVVTGTTQAAVNNAHYVLTNAAATTVTLPASPASGDTVWITPTNGLTTNVIARNAQTIMGLAENMVIDSANATVSLRFVNSSWRLL